MELPLGRLIAKRKETGSWNAIFYCNCYIMKTNILPDLYSGVSCSSERAADDGDSCRLVAYRNLLVPIDFSEHSKKTIEYATQLAALSEGSIKILHVLQMPENLAAFFDGIYIEQQVINAHIETAKRKANDQLSLFTEQILAKRLKVQPALRVGNPYEEIVSTAKEMGADLIVIGSHGHRGLGRMLLGSTAERVLQYAPCAVLVVKVAAVDPIADPEAAELRQD